MTGRLAKRLDGVSESATLKLNAAVQAMKAQGVDVVNLTAGEPDFAVSDEAKQAVIDAVNADKSKYGPASGLIELREAVAAKTSAQQGLKWSPSEVVITNGGKQALFNAMMALVDPGDEVLIVSPYWLSYPEMAKLAGGKPRIIRTTLAEGFKLKPERLASELKKGKPRILIFNSPSNPSGATYTREEFEALGKVIEEAKLADLWIVSDEIYDRIVFDGKPFCSFLRACPNLRDRTITVNGMSKSAAMTGWRIGWSVAPKPVTEAMGTLQGQSTSGINALAQWASVAALKLPESAFAAQLERYARRRDLVLENLGKAGKIELFRPGGAFYAFIGVGPWLREGEDSMGFAERLLEKAKVAVVPGTPFGEPSFLRLSFATDEKTLQEGCRRIVEFLSR